MCWAALLLLWVGWCAGGLTPGSLLPLLLLALTRSLWPPLPPLPSLLPRPHRAAPTGLTAAQSARFHRRASELTTEWAPAVAANSARSMVSRYLMVLQSVRGALLPPPPPLSKCCCAAACWVLGAVCCCVPCAVCSLLLPLYTHTKHVSKLVLESVTRVFRNGLADLDTDCYYTPWVLLHYHCHRTVPYHPFAPRNVRPAALVCADNWDTIAFDKCLFINLLPLPSSEESYTLLMELLTDPNTGACCHDADWGGGGGVGRVSGFRCCRPDFICALECTARAASDSPVIPPTRLSSRIHMRPAAVAAAAGPAAGGSCTATVRLRAAGRAEQFRSVALQSVDQMCALLPAPAFAG